MATGPVLEESEETFLREHYLDQMEEMRWRRGVEYRLVNFLLLLLAILGAAMAQAFRADVPKVPFLAMGGLLVLSILAIAAAATAKIVREHATHEAIGSDVQLLWVRAGLFEKGRHLPDRALKPIALLRKSGGGSSPLPTIGAARGPRRAGTARGRATASPSP